ncbi:FecCD family ABC transporter permease [Aeromicrobium sp. CTD01-1L150]|uniref:FecCD family ABC transporter permease n=1 Tax=Aeromicrobium sp. CTD01-1L150 TaxID=3341830 RepID=UPI0035BFDBAA
MSERSVDTVARPGVQVGPVGVPVRRRAVVATIATGVLLATTAVHLLSSGTVDVPVHRVLATLVGQGDRIENLVVLDGRLARVVSAVVVGFLLGLAGALTQSITRNPIASPDILGVTTGAGAVAVLVVTQPWLAAGLGAPMSTVLPAAAVLGALLTTSIILALAWRGGFDGLRLILVGLGVNALASAVTAWLLVRADIHSATVATRWLAGSVDGIALSQSLTIVPVVGLAVVVGLRLGPALGALRLGRDVAAALGLSPGRAELAALGLAVVATGAATAIAGPVAFVAFVAPQAALRMFGTAGPTPLAAGLVGALLVLVADLVAQRMPVELPVGVVTAVVGAPFLLYLLTRHVRRTSV